MTLLRTSLLNSIAVIIKMLTLLGINKILALYIGPAGYAALGQFQNLVQMITTFAGGSMNIGVTKYTAEFYDDEDKQKKIWTTAGTISFVGSCFVALGISFFAKFLAKNLLHNETYYQIFYWLSGGLIFFVLNALMLAILNGKKEIQLYVLANIFGSVLSFLITVILSVKFGLYGALVSLSIYQSVAFIVTAYICYRTSWFKFNHLFGVIDPPSLLKLSKYSLMVAVSASCVPLSAMLVRWFLIKNYGSEFAGYWEALTRMSGAYLMLVTTTLSLYFLPRYSEIKASSELQQEVLKALFFVVPIATIGGGCVFALKEWLIILLFSKGFSPVEDLVAWQVVGDTLKIISWILGFILWARALVITFIFTEIVFSFGFYFLTVAFSLRFGEKGVVIAYAINYLLYLITLMVYFFFWFRSKNATTLNGDSL
ncbi:O-antigen translocase [Pseudomonas agarici]|uniref:O-antigen translocase n=1 Tax=Pseudomonas agarici TaxID=46677 RepID=UPI0015A0700A|nr:O-antigen translocase [Pseudomonas agarici]NWB91699.1 O-antigen translocase [Pseudomonas agarici]